MRFARCFSMVVALAGHAIAFAAARGQSSEPSAPLAARAPLEAPTTQAGLRSKDQPQRAERVDSGTVVGTVTDKATGAPVTAAVVAVEGSTRSVTTNADGRYRITGVDAG